MDQTLQSTTALLQRTPGALDALLRGLPQEWTLRNEGDGTWTALEVVAHLAHAEQTDCMPRVRSILESGGSREFPPFDRNGFRDGIEGKGIEVVLDDFARLRAGSLDALAILNLRHEDMHRKGRHPALGEVTLSQLLATWAAHDANHLHQIARILAHQYRNAVGPWSRFLGVMQCDGHSVAA